MTFRIGAVGVGPWAQKLATAFRECGAEIVCHDRHMSSKPAPGFGERRLWSEMITDSAVDALIICAPPDVTTDVALECAKAGKRCVATKPLMLTETPPSYYPYRSVDDRHPSVALTCSVNLYVDLWRLYSPAWIAMKEELRGKRIERIDVVFCGNGPFRSFNGALDYGPHALAFVFDLLGTTDVGEIEVTELETDVVVDAERDDGGRLVLAVAKFKCRGVPIELKIGNGAAEGERRIVVDTEYDWHEFYEPNEVQRYCFGPSYPIQTADESTCTKSLALRRFCRAFMVGEASRTLEYSVAAQRVLERMVVS